MVYKQSHLVTVLFEEAYFRYMEQHLIEYISEISVTGSLKNQPTPKGRYIVPLT